MDNLANIIHGIVIGNWLLNVFRRLTPVSIPGRYSVVAENCMLQGYSTIIGRCDTLDKAEAARLAVEDSAAYIGDIFDCMDPEDSEFLEKGDFIPWNELIQADKADLQRARELCTMN